MTNRNFPDLNENTAPEPARASLGRARARWGGIPTPLARGAASPLFLEQAQAALAAFEKTSLSPVEREVVALTMARRNGCEFCLRLHRGLVDEIGAPVGFFDHLAAGDPLPEPRLEALRRFTESLLDRTGDVDDAAWSELLSHGFDREKALEVVLGVGAYTLTTFANRLTESHA